MDKKKHTEQWFINRIKKEIKRDEKMEIIVVSKMKIIDKAHAKYLFLNQNELNLFYYE